MANPTTGLFETLTAAASIASASLKFKNAFIDAVYTEYQPINAEMGVTLNVNIPTVSEGDTVDIGNGPLQPTDTAHDTVAITFDKHFSNSFVIKSWDKIRTPADLASMYLQPRLESCLRKVNRSIAQLVTSTNFTTHTLITGVGADVFQRVDLAGAWANLTAIGVPVDDTANMFMITNPTAYSNMLASTEFVNESVVGVSAAETAQQRAVLLKQFNAQLMYDQHIANYNSGKQAALFFHRHAIAMVTANMPPSGSSAVTETTVFPKPGLPVQIQAEYSLKDQGWLFNVHCGYGIKVVRENFGQRLETA